MTPTTPSAPDEVVLAPCPFCGGAVTIENDTTWLKDGVAWIKHEGRPCGLELAAASEPELREQWNTRVPIASPQPAGVTEEQVAYALLWRMRTTDPRIHNARRALLDAMGSGEQRNALQWALETFGPTAEPRMEEMP